MTVIRRRRKPKARHAACRAANPRCATCSRASTKPCRRTCAASGRRRESSHAANDDDRGDPLAPWMSPWSATTMSSSSARTSAISAACSAARRAFQQKYGKTRCFDAPINGAPASSARPSAWRPTGCAPASRSSSPTTCIRPTTRSCQEAARLRYRSNGQFTCPIVVRMPTGGGIFGGQTHSQSPEALFTHVCGPQGRRPVQPYDAKGLLIAAIEDPDPVIFLEPKRLYNGPFDGHHDRPVTPWSKHPLGEAPEGHYTVPARQGASAAKGCAVTVLAYGTMVYVARSGRGDRHRRRSDRPAHPAAARPRRQ
jgi:hypothetical protein